MQRNRIVVVVGNPKSPSKTGQVAAAVAEVMAGLGDPAPEIEVVEVADLGPKLLGWGDPEVGAAVDAMVSASALVVASPVYKATYTGLLKLFLDHLGAGQLAGVPTVPVMVGAAPQHALAVEVHLRPLLVEVGASCPTRGLYLLESQLDQLGATLDAWRAEHRLALGAALRSRQQDPAP